MDVKEIYNSLKSLHSFILSEKDNWKKFSAVGRFDDLIFLSDEDIGNAEIDDLLTELAHDLEYYNPEECVSDGTYFGDDKFFDLVNPTIKKLENFLNESSNKQ